MTNENCPSSFHPMEVASLGTVTQETVFFLKNCYYSNIQIKRFSPLI